MILRTFIQYHNTSPIWMSFEEKTLGRNYSLFKELIQDIIQTLLLYVSNNYLLFGLFCAKYE